LSGWERQSRRRSYGRSIINLLGHLYGTGLIFVALFVLAWVIAALLAWLNGLQPFTAATFRWVSGVETLILYADTALCCFTSLVAMLRFCKEVIR
jgi:hypothetical protein